MKRRNFLAGILGAAGTAPLLGRLNRLPLFEPGEFVGGGGQGATACGEFIAGKITAIIVTNGGQGYTTNPTVTVTA